MSYAARGAVMGEERPAATLIAAASLAVAALVILSRR
jgi:hypothetical protein